MTHLDPHKPYKPLDFGNGRLAGSVAPDGRLLSLNTYHPEHGYVTFCAQPPFPDEKRFDQPAVRVYRAALAHPAAPAIGLLPDQAWTNVSVGLLEESIPQSQLQNEILRASVTTWPPSSPADTPAIAIQAWDLYNLTAGPLDWSFRWAGLLHLTRASMTQLTEGGVIPMPSSEITVNFDGQTLVVFNPAMHIALAILGLPTASPFERAGVGVPVDIPAQLHFEPNESQRLLFVFSYGVTPEGAIQRAGRWAQVDPVASRRSASQRARDRWQPFDRFVPSQLQLPARHALRYALNCCALPVGQTICLLTDHQILPLSWTRDAYYVASALMAEPNDQFLDLIRRHLLWLFEVARRPHGYWGRAYLPNGKPKDHAFQLDQQCYPLLELLDYEQVSGDTHTTRRLVSHIPSVLEALFARRAPGAHLYTTEETPGDDPLPLPYHLSSQILLWRAFRRLHDLNSRVQFTHYDFDRLSSRLRTHVWRHLVAANQGRSMFVYASDLAGEHVFYHDANDFPTILAPLWGFCASDDPVWRATMEFAFSPANQDGFYPGEFGGLGSVHTPGAWPLGDVQELIYARLTRDQARLNQVIGRLQATACWDGSLPEARDPATGRPISRHWFAWPNCALLYALAHPDL